MFLNDDAAYEYQPYKYDAPTTVTEILKESGIMSLPVRPDPDELERVLTRLERLSANLDKIQKAVLRDETVNILRGLKVSSPGMVADAVFKSPAAAEKTINPFEKIEPWEESVDLTELLDSVADIFRRFVSLPEHVPEALSLWSVMTYVFQQNDAVFDILPRIYVKSPAKRCGKTTLLELMSAIAAKPIAAANITPAALFRVVQKFKPTLVIDEADTFVSHNDELRGILNSGHRRSTAYVYRTVGDNHDPEGFSTFAPMIFAGIGKMHGTLEDRSIVIHMERMGRGETIERLNYSKLQESLVDTRRKLLRVSMEIAQFLVGCDPASPSELDHRAADNWRPSLSIADLAENGWPTRAREAARVLSGGTDETEGSWGIQALEDLRTLFLLDHAERLASDEVVETLQAMEDRPWPESRKGGKPLSTRQLAALLKPFGLSPKMLRMPNGEQKRGYEWELCLPIFQRYCVPLEETPEPENTCEI